MKKELLNEDPPDGSMLSAGDDQPEDQSFIWEFMWREGTDSAKLSFDLHRLAYTHAHTEL